MMSSRPTFKLKLVACWLACAAVVGCSDPAPAPKNKLNDLLAQGADASDGTQAVAVPEWPPGYEGRKPWNRNPETPKNRAYKLQGARIDVTSRSRGGLLFVDEVDGRMVDWPKPRVALVLSGSLQGYIEPCGCAGLENMKGGLGRRHALIELLEKEGWPLVLLDQGELAHRIGPQAAIKYQNIVRGLRAMGYRTIGLGTSDLRLMATDLLTTLVPDSPTHYVTANVGLIGPDNDFTAPLRVIEAGGMKIGVTSVTLSPADQPLQNPDASLADPAEKLKKIVPQLVAQKCDQLVLLVAPRIGGEKIDEDGTRAAAQQLARQFPQFNLIVTATDRDPPPSQLIPVAGTPVKLLELGHKGMFVGVLAFYDDAARPVRYQIVPLDVRFRESKGMKDLLTEYQEELKQQGLEALGAAPRPHPQKSKFVGSKVCGDCHKTAYKIWKDTPHAHALETLAQVSPPRLHDPECLSCHVTGWDAKGYVPYVSGYESQKKTPQLVANGCENCHGPGSAHVDAENDGGDEQRMDALRKQMRLTLTEARNGDSPRGCYRCHDLDNSPNFDKLGFDHYWKMVEHKGTD